MPVSPNQTPPGAGHNRDEIVKASGRETASGRAEVLDFQDQSTYSKGLFMLDVTAAEGTLPTLDVFVQTEMPDSSWTDIVAFSRVSGVGKRLALIVTPVPDASFPADFPIQDRALPAGNVRHLILGPKYRCGWLIGGVAPAFTFSVKATIHT